MSVDIDFSDHGKVLIMIAEAQDAEQDQREAAREAKLFIYKRDGQWDPYAIEKLTGRFRGTFDMVTPIVDQIAGEIEQSDFTLRVSPSGGDSSKDTAKILDGLIRNIRNISNAETVFEQAGRANVISGFDAWEVVQDFVDGDSFDQDLFIRRIPNAVDSVWFDLNSVMQDKSDAEWGIKLISLPLANYRERWPDGTNLSIGDDKRDEAYFNKADTVTVGQFLYKKQVNIELVMMTNGKVYKDDDDFKKVKDDLELQGITIELDSEGEEKRRTRKSWVVHSRMLDGGDWLQAEEETVFDMIPIVPVYGNYENIENKPVYSGKIEKLYDQQRSLNYAMSRDIEDGALSPSNAIWMTQAQAEGHDYSTMNIDRDPIRFYNADQENPGPPIFVGGPQPSTGLQTTVANMQQMIASSSNTFAAGQGNALASQSGIAGEQQISQGNIGSIKWFKSLEIAICQTGRILINAIPKVYDATRTVRILEEDGTSSMQVLNQPILDAQTGDLVKINDLTIGEYDVVCEVGPAFNSQQRETADGFMKLAAIDPTFLAANKDILLKNMKTPGMDLASERARESILNQGGIPESQWTDEERQKIQQAQAEAQNQPPQEDPNLVIAQAEMLKGQAEQQQAQNKQAEIQGNQQISVAQIQLENRKVDLREQEIQLDVAKFQREKDDKFNVDAANIDQGQQKIDQSNQQMLINAEQKGRQLDMGEQQQQFTQLMAQFSQSIEAQKAATDNLNKEADTFKKLREGMGVDVFVGPGITQATIKQARVVQEAQGDVEVEELPELNNDEDGAS